MTIADLNILARYLADADTTTLTAANLLIFINKAYERITGKLITITGNSPWPFGDSNYTAFPTMILVCVLGAGDKRVAERGVACAACLTSADSEKSVESGSSASTT